MYIHDFIREFFVHLLVDMPEGTLNGQPEAAEQLYAQMLGWA